MPAAKEKPILFSGPMVRAILDGRKTQTRRPIKPQPDQDIDDLHGGDFRGRAPYAMECNETGRSTGFGFEDDHGHRWQCPFGQPGTLLWVKETWASDPNGFPIYYADWENSDGFGSCVLDIPTGKTVPLVWQSSTRMPRNASRINLRVKRTWVERVQDISEEDAKAEGVDPLGPVGNVPVALDMGVCRYQFANLWEDTLSGSWDANQWVWACEFERVPIAT